VPRSTQLDDHPWLAELLDKQPAASVEPISRPKPAIRYAGGIDFDRLGPGGVGSGADGEDLEELDRALRRINARFQGGAWFDHLINPPNSEIIAWLDESIDPQARQKLRVIELCGGVGPVAVGLTRRGFRAENMAVTDVDPKHLAMAEAFSREVTGGKIRVFEVDVRNVQCQEQFDVAVISSWENSILPYEQVTAECRNLVADGGLLVMTFLEKSRIESEGYDHFPGRLLQKKSYYTIAVDRLMALFERNGFEPVCYLDHGYPKARFPRHVLVGRKRATGETAADRTFAAIQNASQAYFDQLHRVLSHEKALPSWATLLHIAPLAAGAGIESLPPLERVRLLSLGVRKATCHPFGPWNLDYSRTGFDRPAVLAGLLVGHGNKCGAVAGLTRALLKAHGIACRTIACAGHLPSGEPVQHCLNEVLLDDRWRLLDNDVFQFSDTFLTDADGCLLTREEVLALGVEALVRRYPWPYTFRGFAYDPSWVERNWTAWYHAVAGAVRDLG